MPPAPLPLSARSGRTADSPITFYVRKAFENPNIISLAAGLVDEASFPVSDVGKEISSLFSDPATARAALQYGSTQGLPPLRERLLDRACRADGTRPKDAGLSPDHVVLTTGSQQLLYLVGESLLDPGDLVIVEAPSYFVFLSCLESHGARVLSVPTDDGGMDVDALAVLLDRLDRSGELPRLKLIYTVDYFQNPSGLSLAADRRPRLAALAKLYSKHQRIVVLEDAAYRELRYDGPDVSSVKKFDPDNAHVVYAGTFSKPLSPGLKLGYAILPPDLVGPVLNLKGNHDFGSSSLTQYVALRMLAGGAYDGHGEELRAVYRRKRDAMLAALETEFADWPTVTWTRPKGGLYVWLTFPEYLDAGPAGPLVSRCVAEGVLYVPGQYSHVPNEAGRLRTNDARLSFGVVPEEKIAEGIRRLRAACRGLER
jgi:2-aminoadipate transaminase